MRTLPRTPCHHFLGGSRVSPCDRLSRRAVHRARKWQPKGLAFYSPCKHPLKRRFGMNANCWPEAAIASIDRPGLAKGPHPAEVPRRHPSAGNRPVPGDESPGMRSWPSKTASAAAGAIGVNFFAGAGYDSGCSALHGPAGVVQLPVAGRANGITAINLAPGEGCDSSTGKMWPRWGLPFLTFDFSRSILALVEEPDPSFGRLTTDLMAPGVLAAREAQSPQRMAGPRPRFARAARLPALLLPFGR